MSFIISTINKETLWYLTDARAFIPVSMNELLNVGRCQICASMLCCLFSLIQHTIKVTHLPDGSQFGQQRGIRIKIMIESKNTTFEWDLTINANTTGRRKSSSNTNTVQEGNLCDVSASDGNGALDFFVNSENKIHQQHSDRRLFSNDKIFLVTK